MTAKDPTRQNTPRALIERLLSARLIRNTLTLAFSNGGSALLSLLLSILIGRALGEEGLGVYAAALAWVFPLSLLAEFGINTLMTRDLARADSSEVVPTAAYLQAAALARVLIGGGVMLLLLLAAPLLSRDPAVTAGIRLSAPLVMVNPFYGVFTAVFRARRTMRPVAALNLGMLLAQVVLTALVFAAGAGVMIALVVNLLTSAGQMIAAWAVWRLRFRPAEDHPAPSLRETFALLRPILRRAFPFALAAALAAVQLRAGVILLESLSDTSQVGYFAAAGRFLEGGRMIPHAFFDALLPALSLLAADPARFRRTFRRANLALIVFGLAFSAGSLLFAGPLMALTYGPDFAPAAAVLALLGWSLLPMTLKYARGLYWYARGREGLVNIATLLSLLLQIALSLWLLPRYGAMGAALVALLAEIAALALLWLPYPSSQTDF